MSTVKLQRFVDSCTIQTDNECVRGGQHPHHPAVQGEGQGQDPALVHVRHGHGPAPHGQSRLYNVLEFSGDEADVSLFWKHFAI